MCQVGNDNWRIVKDGCRSIHEGESWRLNSKKQSSWKDEMSSWRRGRRDSIQRFKSKYKCGWKVKSIPLTVRIDTEGNDRLGFSIGCGLSEYKLSLDTVSKLPLGTKLSESVSKLPLGTKLSESVGCDAGDIFVERNVSWCWREERVFSNVVKYISVLGEIWVAREKNSWSDSQRICCNAW